MKKNKKSLPAGRQGKFIVIDGTDGSGKATQTKLLINRLKKEKYRVKTIDFPRYEKNFFGKMVGRYLSGEFGAASEVSPYLASVLYAADRFESAECIKKWLDEGNIVIADRYASSNQIHQGGKIDNFKERKKFLDWLEEMEFDIFKISRPDAIIYLDVPINFSMNLLGKKSAQNKKKYLNGKKDIHENDIKHLEGAKASAMKLIEKNNHWIKINCIKDGALMTRKEISDMIWNRIRKII